MAINNVSVQDDGGFLPDTILLIQCYYYHRETHLLNVLSVQAMIPPKRFDTFFPDWGMLRTSRYVQFFLQTTTAPRRFGTPSR